MGSVWGDYDNDGFEDLFLYRWGRPELFHNDGGRGFTRVSEPAGLPAGRTSTPPSGSISTATGVLDLFMGGYYPETVNLWKLADTKMMPESFEYANNGGRKYLFSNLGGGRFEEVSARVGHRLAALGAGGGGGRSARHRLPDLFIANDYGVSELFINEGGRFREVGRETGVGYAPKSGMNASVGDVLNQGRFAIYVSNISEEGILLQGNNLWVPIGAGSRRCRSYENLARAMGVDLGGWSFGAQFGDLNNDGFLDLYLVNGYVSASRDRELLVRLLEGRRRPPDRHLRRARTGRRWATRSLAGYQQKKVWISDGAGRFIDVAPMVGATDRYDGRSVALADLANRGVLDVRRRQSARPAAPVSQRGGARPRLDRLRSRRRLPGRTGRGASCTQPQRDRRAGHGVLERQQQVQEVSGGSGFCAQNQRRLHFGLGVGARWWTRWWSAGRRARSRSLPSRRPTGSTSWTSRHDGRHQRRPGGHAPGLAARPHR